MLQIIFWQNVSFKFWLLKRVTLQVTLFSKRFIMFAIYFSQSTCSLIDTLHHHQGMGTHSSKGIMSMIKTSRGSVHQANSMYMHWGLHHHNSHNLIKLYRISHLQAISFNSITNYSTWFGTSATTTSYTS